MYHRAEVIVERHIFLFVQRVSVLELRGKLDGCMGPGAFVKRELSRYVQGGVKVWDESVVDKLQVNPTTC